MRNILCLATITLSVLSSCQKEVITSAKDDTSAQGQANQQQAVLGTAGSDDAAVPFHGSFNESLDGVQIYNSCTNEQMTLQGSNHVVFHGVSDGLDSKITFHYDLPGTISAKGESGRGYTVTGTLNAQEGQFSVGEYTFKFINKFRFITTGGGNNFFFETTHYLKVDANGNWTVIRGEVDKTYCR
jgi:hypothetical protein